MSLTMVSGRKSWKAFSVFIFSWSSSWTFSITSFAKTWGWINSMFWILCKSTQKYKNRGGNKPLSRSEHSWQRSRKGEWSGCNLRNVSKIFKNWGLCKGEKRYLIKERIAMPVIFFIFLFFTFFLLFFYLIKDRIAMPVIFFIFYFF